MFCDPVVKNPTYIYLCQKVVLKITKTPKNICPCSAILSTKVQYIYLPLSKNVSTQKDQNSKKSDLFVFTCFCVSTFAFTSVILAVASRFERCSAFLLTFFFKSGRAGQWRNISKTQPESFFT